MHHGIYTNAIYQVIKTCLHKYHNFLKTPTSQSMNIPLRSIHTTQNHWTECPSSLSQDATLEARQFSKPGSTSLYIGILASIISATPFPCDNNSPLAFRLTCCICLLWFPFNLGTLTLPFSILKTSSSLNFEDDNFITFLKIFSHVNLLPLE